MEEQQLDGGVANAGKVVRVGNHVLRPANEFSASIRAFLLAMRADGFDGVPEPLGVDRDGRERFGFIEGDVPIPPYPEWVQRDQALASVARLLRRFHQAAAAFDPSGWTWSDEMVDPAGGGIVLHNDVCLENVVFRDGVAVALIDFDFAAPGRAIFDVVRFARMCIPVDDDVNAPRLGWRPSDKPARLRLVVDAYGLDAEQRAQLLALLDHSIERGGQFVRRRVEARDPNFIAMWNEMGGAERFERRRRWWLDRYEDFADALR